MKSEIVIDTYPEWVYIPECDQLKNNSKAINFLLMILFIWVPDYYFSLGGFRKRSVITLMNIKTKETRIIKEKIKKLAP